MADPVATQTMPRRVVVGGHWTRNLSTARVIFGSGRGGISVDLRCQHDFGVCPRHAMITFEGGEAGWVLTSLGGQCVIGSRRACPTFALNPNDALEGVGDPQFLVTRGERQQLTREFPCFWFPQTPYKFMIEWPAA